MLIAIDDLIPERELAKRLGLHWRTLRRWRKRGIAGVLLHAEWIGGRVHYRQEDLDAFQAAVNAARNPPPPLSCREQKRIDRAVDDRLRRRGYIR